MKKLITFLFIIFIGILFANPIMPACISEFTFDESTWTMEIFDYYQFGIDNLNGCSIETCTCTSYFNDGITCNENGVFVVTENDVQTPFIFNHEGDYIIFDSSSGGLIDEIWFGDFVNAPLTGQSLARFVYSSGDPGFEDIGFAFAKETPPTFGYDPFSVNSFAIFTGYIFDSLLNPVPNVQLEYNNLSNPNTEIFTNESGFFTATLLGRNYDFNIHLAALASIDTTLTIEPDSTYYFEFIFENYVSSDDAEIQLPPSNYNLSNFPNPFNPSTAINFDLTTKFTENTEIHIFNSKGQKIKTISPSLCHPEFIEGRGETKFSVVWNGTNNNNKQVPSGVYLYKLVSNGKELAVNKMLLMK